MFYKGCKDVENIKMKRNVQLCIIANPSGKSGNAAPQGNEIWKLLIDGSDSIKGRSSCIYLWKQLSQLQR